MNAEEIKSLMLQEIADLMSKLTEVYPVEIEIDVFLDVKLK